VNFRPLCPWRGPVSVLAPSRSSEASVRKTRREGTKSNSAVSFRFGMNFKFHSEILAFTTSFR
jgi:hypothetical protein